MSPSSPSYWESNLRMLGKKWCLWVHLGDLEVHAPCCMPALCSEFSIFLLLFQKSEVKVSFSCVWLFVTLWTGPPGSSGHGILRVRILEWAAISFSRGPSWPRDFYCWATKEARVWVCVCVCILLWTNLGGIIIPVLEALNLFIPENFLYRKKLSGSLL